MISITRWNRVIDKFEIDIPETTFGSMGDQVTLGVLRLAVPSLRPATLRINSC